VRRKAFQDWSLALASTVLLGGTTETSGEEITMLMNASRYWLGVFAIFVIDFFAMATVQAQSPFPISSCPYNIATAGSYAVTKDLTATGTCITIAVPIDDVAIDLQGHSVTGGGTGSGIVCFSPNVFGSPCNHILVTNGTVIGFGTGIFLYGHSNTVVNMTVRGSTGSSLALKVTETV
jgi:hypothetical protein